MSKYLQEFLTTLPASNRSKISALLTNSVDNGQVISVAEYAAWYKHVMDTINKFFEPTTKLIPAKDRKLIYSSVLNYLFEFITHDLESLFIEANALFDFTNLSKIQNDNLFGQLRSQVFQLLSYYENLKSMRQHSSDWSKGVYTLFNAGASLFLPRGYMISDNIYTDYNNHILLPMEIVSDVDTNSATGKLVLGGETNIIELTNPELMWEPDATAPDFTLQTGTDINNSIDGDALTHWVEILCFNAPVVNNITPTAALIRSANKSNSFGGNVEIAGYNESHRPREYYIKFITKGRVGEAKYVCSDDGANYTDLVCTNDMGNACKYGYTAFYTQACKNTVCLRYTQIGAVVSDDEEYTSVFNSHNEDTGLAVRFTGDPNGYFYPGDTWKITCSCEETCGARLRYTVCSKCNTMCNWIELKPILDRPFFIDSIQYYDETRHYYEEEGLEPKYLVNVPIYVDAPIRLNFEPRVITRLIINMRQENYTHEQYTIPSSNLNNNVLVKNIVESDPDFDKSSVISLVYGRFGNTDLRDKLMKQPNDSLIIRDTYCYVFGFADLSMGYTEYKTAGRSILKSLRTSRLGIAGLHTVESTTDYLVRTVNLSPPSMIFGTADPVLVSTEYDLFIKNYNSQEGWVSSIEIPMLPHKRSFVHKNNVSTSVTNEHLRVTDGIGKLRFYSTNVTQVYSVYNGEYLTEDEDYTVIQQTDMVPYGTYLDLSDYLAKYEKSANALFVVSYAPNTGVYLDSGKHALLDDDYNVQFNFSELYPKIMYSDIYVLVTGRRNTPTQGMTPLIHKIHLLAGEVDEYKYYPEGDTDEESRESLLTDSTSVK